jgi:tight adherence protein C
MLDILTVSIDAVLSFDISHNALSINSPRAQGGYDDTSMEIQRQARRIALTELGERNNIAELKSLASAVMQSEQMGTPIKNVLKTQAAQLRADRKQAAQEKGMKASVKMLLPMVAFVFPVIFIILMGPTVLNLIKTFG